LKTNAITERSSFRFQSAKISPKSLTSSANA
jgi:hypothetical protein